MENIAGVLFFEIGEFGPPNSLATLLCTSKSVHKKMLGNFYAFRNYIWTAFGESDEI